jgi:hypothetical protein
MGLYADKFSAVMGFVFALIFLTLSVMCAFGAAVDAHAGHIAASAQAAIASLVCLTGSCLFIRAFFKKPVLSPHRS